MPSCSELFEEYKTASPHRKNEIQELWTEMQCAGELPGDDDSGGHGGTPINP